MSGGTWSLLSYEPSSSGVDHSHEPSCRGVDHTCRGVDYGHEPSCSGDKVYDGASSIELIVEFFVL